eukprot:SAG11_NODE_520_length_8780_cov_13.076719_5_plen_67_part_00
MIFDPGTKFSTQYLLRTDKYKIKYWYLLVCTGITVHSKMYHILVNGYEEPLGSYTVLRYYGRKFTW